MNPLRILEPLVALGGGSIQPIDPGDGFAREADPVDRLAADSELITRLMFTEYDGPEWHLFRTALARYGVAVLHKWILSGRIFVECARKGFGRIALRRWQDRDEAVGLAGETVARALIFFRDRVLVRGIWDPSRGASVRTYFVGACILTFPNVYQRLLGGERLERRIVRGRNSEERSFAVEDFRPFSRPDNLVELASDFHAIPGSDTRAMVLLNVEGYSHAEIAADFQTTAKAVELRLYKVRRGIR